MNTVVFILFIIGDIIAIYILARDYGSGERDNPGPIVIRLFSGILFIALSAFYTAYYLTGKI